MKGSLGFGHKPVWFTTKINPPHNNLALLDMEKQSSLSFHYYYSIVLFLSFKRSFKNAVAQV